MLTNGLVRCVYLKVLSNFILENRNMRIVIIPSADLSYNSGSVIYAKRLFSFRLKAGMKCIRIEDSIDSSFTKEITR